MRKAIVLFSLIAGLCLNSVAQKSELSFVAGGKITPDGTSPTGKTTFNKSFAFEVGYATQLISAKAAALELEIPLTASPNTDVNTSNVFTAKSYSSIYVTPGFRVRLAPDAPFSPWIAGGVGFVHFSPSSTNLAGGPSGANSSTKAAYSVGGGLDLRPGKSPIAFRFEARELYTGVPNLAIPRLNVHNNVLLAGGIVVRF
ncbi:MAG TPA: hypothetical protein VEW69_08910 [Alphaproteobacteria bacterium]|nr:hypothetical protein [Alphaproteobacteria bacterium]